MTNRHWLFYFTNEAIKKMKNHKGVEELHYELPSYYSIQKLFGHLEEEIRNNEVEKSEFLLLIFFNFGERGKNAVVNFILGNWDFGNQTYNPWDFNNFIKEYFIKGGKNE